MIRARFTTPLCTRLLDDRVPRHLPWWRRLWRFITHRRRYVLLAPLRYESAALPGVIIVPTGDVTDMASVPRVPLFFFLTGDTAHEAAVVHDYLYTHQHLASRWKADRILREAMAAKREPWWRRWLMWLGVRAGGWIVWHRRRRAWRQKRR